MCNYFKKMLAILYKTLNFLSTWFWNENIWLPANMTWNDVKPNKYVKYTDYHDLYKPIPMAGIILIVRFFIERKLFSSLGVYWGIKPPKYKTLQPNNILEKAYLKSNSKGKLLHYEIVKLSKQLDWDTMKIKRWLRIRHSKSKTSILSKFCESTWRCFYYLFAFLYGFCCLWAKPWFWDSRLCWYDYPHHSISNDVWWYYMFELTFYWSLTITQFTDVKRKDFWEMFIHHVITICLLCLSWTCNLTRMGTLVLLLHDCADIFLEAAKMARYANNQLWCSFLFIVFTVLWIFSRLGVFPFWILRSVVGSKMKRVIFLSTAVEAPRIIPIFPVYYIFNGLLLVLLLLHTIWTYFILKTAVRSISFGTVQKDERSSSSYEAKSSDELISNENKIQNCNSNYKNNSNYHKSDLPLQNGPSSLMCRKNAETN